jgi:acetyl esterase/lipase
VRADEPARIVTGIKETSFVLDNLRTGTDYEWYVKSVNWRGAATYLTNGVFRTESGVVRWVNVPGARNVRDLGGWTGLRQGRVFRGSQLNALAGYPIGLSAEGRRVLVSDLGIRCEVDFRAPNRAERGDFVSEGALGVKFLSRPVPPPPQLVRPAGREAYREALKVFADEANYPVYMHCAAGAERTGMVAFMLEGLCGVPEEIISADFELTGFSCFDERPRDLKRFRVCMETIRVCRGATLEEKFADFAIRGLGLTVGEVAAIRRNLMPRPGGDDIKLVKDVVYDASIGRFGTGDLYLPPGAPAKDLVLLIHGGGWAYGNRAMCDGVTDFFVRERGAAVYNIDYRLASKENPFPRCAEDCVKAGLFVLSPAFRKRYGIAAERIWICGGSAGGHLALWTGFKLPPEKVAGILDFSGIGDAQSYLEANRHDFVKIFGTENPSADMLQNISITSFDFRLGMPRVIATHALGDRVVDIGSAIAFVEKYRAAGNHCETFFYTPREECEGLTGHCIWIPGSWPHKLIPSIENAFARFMEDRQ